MRPNLAHPLAPAVTVALCATVWGLYWLPLRAAEAMGVAGAWAVAAFNLPAMLLAFIILGFDHKGCRGRWGRVAVAGLLAGAGLAFYAAGLVFTSVVRTTVLFYLTPIWGTLLAMLLLAERPGPRRWLAVGMAMAGLALILGLTADDLRPDLGPGEALGLVSGLCWAAGAVAVRGMDSPPFTALTAFQYVAVMAVSVLVALASGAPAPDVGALAAMIASWVTLQSLLMLLTLFAIFWAVGRMSPGRSGLLMMTEVVVAVLSATILLPEEAMTATEWAGALLIVAAGIIEVGAGES